MLPEPPHANPEASTTQPIMPAYIPKSSHPVPTVPAKNFLALVKDEARRLAKDADTVFNKHNNEPGFGDNPDVDSTVVKVYSGSSNGKKKSTHNK